MNKTLLTPQKGRLRSFWGVCLAFLLSLTGLAGCHREAAASRLHYGAFDTVIRIHAPLSQRKLDALAETAFAEFDRLSRLFDIYYGYSGVTNLYDVNQRAAKEPVAVEPDILHLLEYGIEAYTFTEGRVNIALGSVLSLWHEAREKGALPDPHALSEAMGHCDISNLILDPEAGTVYFADSAMSLDVGAVAKGWACQMIADQLESLGYHDFLINAGGNIVARGNANTRGRRWNVGIRDPNADSIASMTSIQVTDAAVVTSGDYQRYMMVGEERYHHIIDPVTGYPGLYARAVTVVCRDSGLADVLSTAFFLMPASEALTVAEALEVGVLIVTPDGAILENRRWPNQENSD